MILFFLGLADRIPEHWKPDGYWSLVAIELMAEVFVTSVLTGVLFL